MGNIYYTLSNYILEAYDVNEEIYCLFNRYYISVDKEKRYDILKKIKEKQDNLLDEIWNIVYKKKRKRETVKIKTDKNKDIDKYLNKLKKIIDDDSVRLLDAVSMIQNLIGEIKDIVNQAVVTLCLNVNIDKKLIKSFEKIFKKHNNEILESLRETADSLTCK